MGNILVSNFSIPFGGQTGINGILKIDATSGDVSVLSSGNNFSFGSWPRGIFFNPASPQNLWVACKSTSLSSVLDVNTMTEAQTVISSGGLLQNPGAITEDGLGDILVFNAPYLGTQSFNYLPATIVRVDPVTGSQTLLYSYNDGNLGNPQAILVIPEPSASAAILSAFALLATRRPANIDAKCRA